MISSLTTMADRLVSPQSPAVLAIQAKLRGLTDAALQDQAHELRDRLANGCSERSLASRMFALTREAARRCLGLEHRDNQLRTGWHLLHRRIVELPTGEGKTLAVTPALALRALAGRGVWLATANDYLARRDALTMSPVFALLGFSTGFLQASQAPAERRDAYQCDITYGTIREFGFDFLRDKLQQRRGSNSVENPLRLQRALYSMFIDEADSIMLDDARTPLIISEPQPARLSPHVFHWSVTTGRSLQAEHDYFAEAPTYRVWLTESGRAKVRQAADREVLAEISLPEAHESVSQAIQAETSFRRDRDYVVRDSQIVIVDRSTGRLAEGRSWQDGIQQVLQAANGLEVEPQTRAVAQITIQAFLRKFEHLAGMTGTAREAAREFSRVYGLGTVVVPPFQPCRRTELPPQVFNSRSDKWNAVVAAVCHSTSSGRPILIGTRDLQASEELSRRLNDAGIGHQVLTARQEEHEAELIAAAGHAGMVTVSTNIAGRGTDVRLEPEVEQFGGLHVISADLFDAARLDRQLAGRGGRQGAPATYQKILSLEDEILRATWEDADCQHRVSQVRNARTSHKLRLLCQAQHTLERRHAQARFALLRSERERIKRHSDLGFDPDLDNPES